MRYKNRRNLDSSSRPDRPQARSCFADELRGLRKGNLRPTHPAGRTTSRPSVFTPTPNILQGGGAATTISGLLAALRPTQRPNLGSWTACTCENAHFSPHSCLVVAMRVVLRIETFVFGLWRVISPIGNPRLQEKTICPASPSLPPGSSAAALIQLGFAIPA